MSGSGVWGSLGLALGLFFIFVGERVFGEGGTHDVLVILGGLLVLGTVALRASARQRAQGPAREAETKILIASVAILISLLLYVASTDWGLSLLGLKGSAGERCGGALGALWRAVMIVGLLALFFMEFAYRRMPIAEAVELRRVRSAGLSGTSLGLAFVFLFSGNYVISQRDVKKDLSYFKTTRPSETTVKMVRRLGEPVTVLLFYPPVNEVLDQVRPYFEQLDKLSPQLSVRVRDHALEPDMAKQHNVRGNGFVVLLKGKGKGQQAETFEVGTDLEVARARLKTLDSSFQKAFSKLTTVRRELHITTGHDERSTQGGENEEAGQKTTEFETALERSNIRTRPLGMAQGLAQQVPTGAPAVAVLGPRKPFLPEEARTLLRYVEGGGRLLVTVDPSVDHGLDPLLHGLGLELQKGVLCSERQHLRRASTQADRAIVFSNQYSAHPIVTVASRNAARVATIFLQGGSLARYQGQDANKAVNVVFPLRGPKAFWRDLDNDFEQDGDEALQEANMIAAVTLGGNKGPEGRAVIVADGDFATDQLIRNPGNLIVLSDALQWLIGQEQIVGEATSEEDVRIEHTRDEDKFWFYGTSFGVPLPILGLGIWMAVRRRRRRESK